MSAVAIEKDTSPYIPLTVERTPALLSKGPIQIVTPETSVDGQGVREKMQEFIRLVYGDDFFLQGVNPDLLHTYVRTCCTYAVTSSH